MCGAAIGVTGCLQSIISTNIMALRDWLGVDTKPLHAAGTVMKAWIEKNADRYYITEQEREDMRTENVLKEVPKVRYFGRWGVSSYSKS